MTQFKDIDVAGLQVLLEQGGVQLVDVRTDLEIARGFIPGTSKLPLHLLPLRLGELDKGMPTVFYCQVAGVLHKLRRSPRRRVLARFTTCRAGSWHGHVRVRHSQCDGDRLRNSMRSAGRGDLAQFRALSL